jgi:hypothetical protein
MSNKFSTPTNLKAPPVCRVAPPWPTPTRLPRGVLTLIYNYQVSDGEARTITNVGTLLLQPTLDGQWNNDPDVSIPGVPYAVFTWDPEGNWTQLVLEINFEPGLGIEFTSEQITLNATPPFHWQADLTGDQPETWPTANAFAVVNSK